MVAQSHGSQKQQWSRGQDHLRQAQTPRTALGAQLGPERDFLRLAPSPLYSGSRAENQNFK